MVGRRSMVPDSLARMALLSEIRVAVERQVIPRIADARRGAGGVAARDVAQFARLVLADALEPSEAFVARLRRDGHRAEALCTGLLAQTARHLGDLWVSDRLSFAEVTLGTARLQRLLRWLAPAFACRGRRPFEPLSALFVSVPGETHSFGLSMLATFFRAAGWVVEIGSAEGPDGLVAGLADDRHDLLGISIGCDVHLPMLETCCAEVRRAPRRRALSVMVGGPLLIARPEVATGLAIDGTANDPAEALAVAEHLVSAAAMQRRTG